MNDAHLPRRSSGREGFLSGLSEPAQGTLARETMSDPKPGEREYYTHRQTGDLGWKVIRDGREMVKLDRPAYDDVRPFSDNEWIRKAEVRPLIPSQVAQIAWAADRMLLLYLQQPEAAKRKWMELTEEKRKAWMERGPEKEGIRKMLWRGIMKTLDPLVEK